eukprot:807691-Rhodomonas_salina.1
MFCGRRHPCLSAHGLELPKLAGHSFPRYNSNSRVLGDPRVLGYRQVPGNPRTRVFAGLGTWNGYSNTNSNNWLTLLVLNMLHLALGIPPQPETQCES